MTDKERDAALDILAEEAARGWCKDVHGVLEDRKLVEEKSDYFIVEYAHAEDGQSAFLVGQVMHYSKVVERLKSHEALFVYPLAGVSKNDVGHARRRLAKHIVKDYIKEKNVYSDEYLAKVLANPSIIKPPTLAKLRASLRK